eukprot:scaffold47897_cov63-Phaeocystis_antarctica.AAC.8
MLASDTAVCPRSAVSANTKGHRKVEQPLVACDAVSVPGTGAEVAYDDGMNHSARINRLGVLVRARAPTNLGWVVVTAATDGWTVHGCAVKRIKRPARGSPRSGADSSGLKFLRTEVTREGPVGFIEQYARGPRASHFQGRGRAHIRCE